MLGTIPSTTIVLKVPLSTVGNRARVARHPENHTKLNTRNQAKHVFSLNCKFCNTNGEHEFIVGNHVNSCPSYPLNCPTNCGKKVLRKNLEMHKEECPLETVSCSFSELGCKVKVQRKDLKAHVESSTLEHMTTLAKSLQSDHMTLKADHMALKADHMTLKADHTMLKAKHAALKAENAKLKSAIAAQLSLSERIHVNQDIADEVDQIHSFLLGASPEFTSRGFTEKSFRLTLPLTKTSIDHCITVSDYQFRLAISNNTVQTTWYSHRHQLYHAQDQSYNLKLYIVIGEDHPALPTSLICDVKVRTGPDRPLKKLATIRQRAPFMPISTLGGFRSDLLGSIDCYSSSDQKDLEIYFSPITTKPL